MEEENMGCREVQEERIDTRSVTACFSTVSLMDVRHLNQEHHGNQNRASPSVAMEVPLAYMLSAVEPPTYVADVGGSSHRASMAVSEVTFVNVDSVAHATASRAKSIDVSDVTCVDISHATPPEPLLEQGHDKVDGPSWAELFPDVLTKVFNLLPLEDVLHTIPCVCQAWRLVSQDVPCWQNVDLSEWSCGKQPRTLDRMLLLVAHRSRGCLQDLFAPNIDNDNMLRLIANSGSQLQVLRIPDSFVSEECLCELAPKFTSLTYLDISGRFPSRALIKSLGEYCPSITRLNMNMRINLSNVESCDIAVLSVAQYMPQLKHLEMAYGLLSNVGLKTLLERCTSLEHLDLRGCWHVNMEEEDAFLNARNRIKVFLSPVFEDDRYDISDEDDIDDDYDDLDLDFLDYEGYFSEDLLDSDDFMGGNAEYIEDFIDDDFMDVNAEYIEGFIENMIENASIDMHD